MNTSPPKLPIHDEGSLKAFDYYATLIRNEGFIIHNQADSDPTHPAHLLWMCEHCKETMHEMPVDKYSRWLGYIQGCLIMQGWTTVEDERNRTRPWFNDPNRRI